MEHEQFIQRLVEEHDRAQGLADAINKLLTFYSDRDAKTEEPKKIRKKRGPNKIKSEEGIQEVLKKYKQRGRPKKTAHEDVDEQLEKIDQNVSLHHDDEIEIPEVEYSDEDFDPRKERAF